MEKIIFFGNGPLADYTLEVLSKKFDVIFHARDKEDLETVKLLKAKNPEAHGVLASFGVLIKFDVLDIFEPEGILNIHPSLLPLYRGASPIESAILAGDTEFSVSVMKLVKAMDAGPIYFQETLKGLPICKNDIYKALAECGAKWIVENISNLSKPVLQDDSKATFCGKFDKSMSELTPEKDTAEQTFRKIVAYQGFPKPKYTFFGVKCIITEAHIAGPDEDIILPLTCADGCKISINKLQPEGRKVMDAKSFLNGYKK
jgi:methionyl-tRNA formyltransferase